jgi:hypothetical protein
MFSFGTQGQANRAALAIIFLILVLMFGRG